jgi:hypothetical protein
VREVVRQEHADNRTVDDAYRTSASRSLGADVAKGYTKRLALTEDGDYDDPDFPGAKAKVAAVMAVPGVSAAVEAAADTLANDWLGQLRTRIKGLSEDRKGKYDELRRQAREPQPVEIVPPKARIENTEDADGNRVHMRDRHLLADEQGDFPVEDLNDWERTVLDAELGRPETLAWYRNPSASTGDALQIPYEMNGKWKGMQPDFIVFSKKFDGTIAASIVDPHGAHLVDALPKLKGLAQFAERYADYFLRIDAIAKVDSKGLRVLDLKEKDVRQAVLSEATSVTKLYQSAAAGDFT